VGRLREIGQAAGPFVAVASVGVAALAFGVADVVEGSGFLAVYLVGLWVGNTPSRHRRQLVTFHTGLAFLAQVALFVVLGLLVFPTRLDEVVLPALALTVVLTLVARPISVWISTAPWRFSWRERIFISWAGLRGAVPIVLATFALSADVGASDTIFNAVFFVAVASAVLQGPTLVRVVDRLGLRTRMRASDEAPLEIVAVDSLGADLLEYVVDDDDHIVGRAVRELGLPRDALLAIVVRGEEALPPRGSTVIEAGDRLYVLARHTARPLVRRIFAAWDRGDEPATV
jgi:cell volume regulation protein A